MERHKATTFCRDELIKHGLTDWGVRLTTDATKPFLGLCSYKDKCIILNAHHIDIHPEPEVIDTVLHEIAHALCPGHGHDDMWRDKAKELGCTNTNACSHLSLSPDVINAIRSGATVEISFDEQVIRTPKYKITRLQDKCPKCGKIAKLVKETTFFNARYQHLECGHVIIKEIPKGTPFETMVSNTWRDEIKSCKHQFNKNQCVNCREYRAFPYQIEGMKFIEDGLSIQRGAAIFDEMGLGKTIQALGYLKFHPEKFPVIFFIKSGIKFQWLSEYIKWLGPMPVQVIMSGQDYLLPGMSAYFMSYDILTPKTRTSKTGKKIVQGLPLDKVLALKAKTIVLDECQQIKNPDSTRTQMIRQVCKAAEHVIPLSGTPWKNRGSEFYVALNLLDPKRFWNYEMFRKQWVETYWDGKYEKEGGIRSPAKFKEYIKDIVIRRERTEVMKELPLVNRMLHMVEVEKEHQEVYDEAVSGFVKLYNDAVIGGDEDKLFGVGGCILGELAKLRHATGLAKIPATLEFVDEFVEETERKLVIFVHHQDVGYILFDKLSKKYGENSNSEKKMPIFKLEGGMDSALRFEIQQKFNQAPRAILVASTLAAGEGLNLQTCADCILHERQWNPANEEQAEGRFIRIGQTATSVGATYVTQTGSIDEHLAGIVERKRAQFHSAMNQGEMPIWKQSDIVKELTEKIVSDWNKKQRQKKVG